MIRVLIVGGLNLDHSIWSIHRGFERLGCQVAYLPTDMVVAGKKLLRPNIKDEIRKELPDADLLLWWQPKMWKDLGFIRDIRKQFPALPTMMWSVDDPHVLDYDPKSHYEFEYAATCCPGSESWYAERGVKALAVWTPCDPDRHGKAVATEAERCDIAFSSTNYYPRERFTHIFSNRIQMVQIIWNLGKVHLYGEWDKHQYSWGGGKHGLTDDYKTAWRGQVPGKKIPGVYAAARINLGSTVRPDGYQYINRRTIECMASGGFMLSDRVAGIGELLEEDKEIVLWSNLDELRAKCKWWLAHEDKRAELAARGRAKSLDIFDNAKMALRMLEACDLRNGNCR